MVNQLVVEKSTSGKEKTEALIHYTMLNDRRMKRWEKTITIPENIKDIISQIDKKITWLIITESWCGDAAHIMPVLYKIAQQNNNITVRVVLRDDNKALMNLFLTQGNCSIPVIVMIDDKTGAVINTYGPRPSTATKMVNVYKKNHGKLTPEFKENLQRWYNKDKGKTIINDVIQLLVKPRATL